MRKKLLVGVLFGGVSGEHEVSLRSAASILQAIDRRKYIPIEIGISKSGKWYIGDGVLDYLSGKTQKLPEGCSGCSFLPGQPGKFLWLISGGCPTDRATRINIVFPVLHGPFGEDGTIQGLLEVAGIPYVGAGVAASAVGMDKDLMKAVFKSWGLPILPYLVVKDISAEDIEQQVADSFGYPCFVKPANLGSSVGISRVDKPGDLAAALEYAAMFDNKVIIEKAAIGCQEIECAVLGNEDPKASVCGEIIPKRSFYDYEAKYLENTTELVIPANLPEAVATKVQTLAVEAFKAIDCAGMARVDFFVCKDQVYINEINTLPGFTSISMYPKLWEATGISYPELIHLLLKLGLDRYGKGKQLKRTL
ncbi:MAG: D-alanine--D-alanine ligase [Limnochordia bacterium]|nr:D-alanine--D-alanine ligase [Limnochordia bacterium]MDD4516952.1 D-alanine--D-alanine ligase [Limnochordia bacterium]